MTEPRAPRIAIETYRVAALNALRTVHLCTLTDAFALVPEEVVWTGYQLDQAFAPLMATEPMNLPVAVTEEMTRATYSARLAELTTAPAVGAGERNKDLMIASAAEWAESIMQTVTTCYDVRPLTAASMQGQITGALLELGVGAAINPRPSRYLPNDVRLSVATRHAAANR